MTIHQMNHLLLVKVMRRINENKTLDLSFEALTKIYFFWTSDNIPFPLPPDLFRFHSLRKWSNLLQFVNNSLNRESERGYL